MKRKSKKPVERIQVAKSDEIALIIERIIDSGAPEVVLTIPRFSRISETPANFHLIKREADLLNKRVVIESVDDKVIELAGEVELESVNPLFVKRRQFSDIVSSGSTTDLTPPPKKEESHVFGEEAVSASEPEPEMAVRESAMEEAPKPKRKLSISMPKPKLPKRLPRRRTLLITGIAVLALILFGSIAKALPKADILITTEKTPWEFNDSITLRKDDGMTQVFHDSRNLTVSFPASGVERIERKAHGTINVYNAYSSEAQPLVVRTRFVTPDGKIYRLTEGITVPPAKVVAGKITPSSIEAEVTADEPGEEYNIGPIEHFSVPGFQGTAKYEGFYGTSDSGMTGGFIGEAAVPTEGDIRGAKENVSSRIEEALTASVLGSLPNDFKIVDGAAHFQITQQDIIEETNNEGNFSVFTEAEMDVVAFKEEDVIAMVREKMQEELGEDFDFRETSITYGEADADFDSGTITIPVTFTGLAYRPIDTDGLKEKIVGQTEEDLRVVISSLPGFKDGQVSFWPFWVNKVPSVPQRVNIDIR